MPAWLKNFVAVYGWQSSWSGSTSTWVVFCGQDLEGTGDMVTVPEDMSQQQFMDAVKKRGLR